MPPTLQLRRPPRSGRALVAACAASAGLLVCGAAPAAATVSGDVSSFSVTPTATTAGSHPDVNTSLNFSYAHAGDSIKNVTVTLPPGLLAGPAAVSATCSASQLASMACPAAAQIGSGSATTTGATASMALYLMPVPSGSSDPATVAGAGLILSALGSPITSATGVVDVATSSGQPVLQLKVQGLPHSVQLVPPPASPVPVSVSQLQLKIDGTSSTGKPFTRLPTSCGVATTTVSVDTYTGGTASGTGSDSFTPTGCSTLPYAPKITATAALDSGDQNVSLETDITQAVGEAGNKSVTLGIPASLLTPNTSALSLVDKPTPVGTATAITPLLKSPLHGQVFLVSTPSLGLAVKFPAPFALTLHGAVSIATESVSFTNVPDIPLSKLAVDLAGGTTGLFTANCRSASAPLSAAFTSQAGSNASSNATLSISGCAPATSGKPGLPKAGSGALSGLITGKPQLGFSLTAGKNAPNLSSFTVKLPAGMSYIKKTLAKGVSVSGAKIKSIKLVGGRLVVTLKSPVRALKITLSSKALAGSSGLASKLKKHTLKSLKATITIKDAGGSTKTLTLTITNPK